MSNYILNIKNICKTFTNGKDKKVVLKNYNLDIASNSILAIHGKSGCGKSTLLNIMSATLRADKGQVIFQNRNIQDLSNKERAKYRCKNVGYIPQNLYLLDDRNIFDNIALPLIYANKDKKTIIEKVENIAKYFDIENLLKLKPNKLSRGEKQRVAICRAVVKKPQIIFADEPTSSLDSTNEFLVLKIFEELKYQGTTIVLTTHDNTVSSFCDQIVYMKS